jgi:hypothetical protein
MRVHRPGHGRQDKEEIFFTHTVTSPRTHVPGADENGSVPELTSCSISARYHMVVEEYPEAMLQTHQVVLICIGIPRSLVRRAGRLSRL